MAPTNRNDAGRTSSDGGCGTEAMGEPAAPGGAPRFDTESESDVKDHGRRRGGRREKDHA